MSIAPFDLSKQLLAIGPDPQVRHFSDVLQAIDDNFSTLIFHPSGRVIKANKNFLRRFGYASESIAGRDIAALSPSTSEQSEANQRDWQATLTGKPHTAERQRLHCDGTLHCIQAFYVPLRDSTGRISYIAEISWDITGRLLQSADDRSQVRAINASQAVIQFSLDGTILDANKIFLAIMGYRLEEIVGRSHQIFVSTEEAKRTTYIAFWDALRRGTYQNGDVKYIGKDGQEVWLQASYNPIMDVGGRPVKVIQYATDITEEKLKQADFQSQITAIEKSQGVMTMSLSGIILGMNTNLLEMLGYQLGDVVGRHHRMLMDPQETETIEYLEFWHTLRSGKFLSGRYRRIGKDGKVIWLQASYNPIFDLNGRLEKIMKFAIDITADVAMAEAFEDAKRQAHHDPATLLPNRTRLNSFLLTQLAVPQASLTLMCLDLDRFKAINDNHGHAVGDKVLGTVADRLRRALRENQLAARIGGDEFVVAAPHLTEEEAATLAQRLIKLVTQPITHEGSDLSVGLSIGIAMAPVDGHTADALLRAADTALYRSKNEGRGRHQFYSTGMSDRLEAQKRLTDELRHGIDADELFLEFQPRLDARTRRVLSAEALVRWLHPVHGKMAPDLFIALAERSGSILALGDWVLKNACRAATKWPNVGVSINVSPAQFRADRLVDKVRDALTESGLEPRYLELELTEGMLLEDAHRACSTMHELKALGVRLAIDDFGTGYSSLSYLRTFPFDVLKIDRQFIDDLEIASGGRAIVQAILALGKALGLTVTAEGVETEQQMRMLVEDGCEEVQGFLLARPMAVDSLRKIL